MNDYFDYNAGRTPAPEDHAEFIEPDPAWLEPQTVIVEEHKWDDAPAELKAHFGYRIGADEEESE